MSSQPSTMNSYSNELSVSAEFADGESRQQGDQIAVEPCPTSLLSHRPDAAKWLSPELGIVASFGTLETARGSCPSRGGVCPGEILTSPTTPMAYSGLGAAMKAEPPTRMILPGGRAGVAAMTAINRRGEEGIPAISNLTRPKVLPKPPNKYESQVVPDECIEKELKNLMPDLKKVTWILTTLIVSYLS